MPTLFFENADPHQKIRFDTFGHSKTMKTVRTKAIHDIRFLTHPHADFDAPRPAHREEEHYGAHGVAPKEFTALEKATLRNAMTLAMQIVDDGYEAMCNYLRFKKDPDNAHVLKFKIRMKKWLGVNYPGQVNSVTSAMRKMQDKIQDPETFITFVNMENQRKIACTKYATTLNRLDLPDAPVYENVTHFQDYSITIPSRTSRGCVWSGAGCGGGIRMYVADIKKYTTNESASLIIHELSHSILSTKDNYIDGSKIYGIKACKALVSFAPEYAVNIACNWEYFYMSFGCYPGQEEYAYQTEYEIKDPQQANNSWLEKLRQKNNIFEPSNTCVTFEDLEILDARNELL